MTAAELSGETWDPPDRQFLNAEHHAESIER
jgi:hypothetical protein